MNVRLKGFMFFGKQSKIFTNLPTNQKLSDNRLPVVTFDYVCTHLIGPIDFDNPFI